MTADVPGDPQAGSLDKAERDRIRTALELMQRQFGAMGDSLDALDPQTLTVDQWLAVAAALGNLEQQRREAHRTITRSFGLTSALATLRHYLIARAGRPVSAVELAAVSGIGEWARRVRELRLEEGWPITTGPHPSGLGTGEYRLEKALQDSKSAKRWKEMNTIRRQGGSAQNRLLALLKLRYPAAVSREDLNYVAGIDSRDRRKRDLEEAGWLISSRVDDPTLPRGFYRLDSLEQGPPRARTAIKQRQMLLADAHFRCDQCANGPETGHQLQVHHKEHVQYGGDNDPENLVVLCRPCHAGIHALAETAVRDELLEPAADPFRN